MDTLSNKSFPELKEAFYENYGDSLLARNIVRFTLRKATIAKNHRAIANSYIRLYATYFNNVKNGKKYLDSSIAVSERHNLKDLLAQNYLYRGNLFYYLGKDQKASNDYLKAKSYTSKEENIYYRIILNIGILKAEIGKNQEAIEIFEECLKYSLSKATDQISNEEYSEILYAFSSTYTNMKLHDSATKYAKRGYKHAKKLNDSSHLMFTYIEGNNKFFQKKYNVSKDSLLKSISYLIETEDFSNLSIGYHYLGKVSEVQNNQKKMMSYFKKVDSIYEETGYAYPETRGSYEKLIHFYEKNNDSKKQLFYVKRLLKIDSILNKRYRYISSSMHKEFDTKNLLTEKNILEIKLKKSKESENKSIKNIYILIILLLSISIILIINYRKRKIYKRKFLELLNQIDTPKSTKEESKNKIESISDLDIDQNIINNILNKLKIFEEEKGFLRKGITLNSLAKQCYTNSKYLSKIINKYKENTFRNYINNLRIEYVVRELKENKNFRKYTVKAIADEAGFSNSESYARAFFKFTGIHTSYFIKNISA
ncbi:MAG: helix-turn-helix domain-containing protein [Kordia sp.]|uniref:helix-turn-helix domain-containing protein n=1 Tax=Kordia sp. TaxID=1965332 RepID=UPI00385C77DA